MDVNGIFRKTVMGVPRQKPMQSMCRDQEKRAERE